MCSSYLGFSKNIQSIRKSEIGIDWERDFKFEVCVYVCVCVCVCGVVCE